MEKRARVAPAPATPADITDGSTELEVAGRSRMMALAEMAGIRRVDVVAWRDLEDAEAGGS